jgi:hypothetical protein
MIGSQGIGHPGSDGGLTMTDAWMTGGSVCFGEHAAMWVESVSVGDSAPAVALGKLGSPPTRTMSWLRSTGTLRISSRHRRRVRCAIPSINPAGRESYPPPKDLWAHVTPLSSARGASRTILRCDKGVE